VSDVRKLTVDDILDQRAYERVRDERRRAVIELKQRRRVALGEFISVVFENTETMRHQVQEMARAERMMRDEQIAHEVATYNDLIPGDGQLSCTLFIELDDEWKLREWLPRLVGIESSIVFMLPDGTEVRGYDPEADRLTRNDTTAAVHFLKFDFDADAHTTFLTGPVGLRCDHPEYSVSVDLTAEQLTELRGDLA
jgi:Protein of unknown function (DUF3501)